MKLPALALLFATILAGCGPRVPPIPAVARQQVPRSAPNAPWVGRGRLEVVTPTGRRISCTAIVRALGTGTVRAAFLSDEGIELVEVEGGPGVATVTKAIPDLATAAPHLARLIAQAYGGAPVEVRTWEGEVLVGRVGAEQRWYGGDPVLLRAVTGGGLDLVLEDWRQLGGELLAYEARAEGPLGLTIRVHLTNVELREAANPRP